MPGEYREEYLEAIYELTEEDKAAKTTEIAKKLRVKSGSVTEMLRKLSREGYVEYSPYKGVTLTKKGLAVATRLKRKHRLLERFLYDLLHLRKAKVHEEACRMEHSLSDEAADALDRLLGHPKRCPDDHRIIPKKGAAKRGGLTLLDASSGRKYIVLRLNGCKKMRSCLRDIGIREGGLISLVARQPARGPLVIKAGDTTITVGRGMASKISVREK